MSDSAETPVVVAPVTGRLETHHVELLHAFFCTPRHAWECLRIPVSVPWAQFLSIWYGRGAKMRYIDLIRRHLNVWRAEIVGADRTDLKISLAALERLTRDDGEREATG